MPDQRRAETNRARQAFEDYYALGPGRSFSQLVAEYASRPKNSQKAVTAAGTKGGRRLPQPPTRWLSQIKDWSSAFGWQARVAARDREIAQSAQAALEAERAAALSMGYAVMHRRLSDLNELAVLLRGEIYDDDKRWLPDVKQIGQGESAERVDLVRFNAPLIEQYRKVLDDMAAELGERVKGIEIAGKGGGPLVIQDGVGELTNDQLRRHLAGLAGTAAALARDGRGTAAGAAGGPADADPAGADDGEADA